MSCTTTFVEQMFQMPGEVDSACCRLSFHAAKAHKKLVYSISAERNSLYADAISVIIDFLQSAETREQKEHLLGHPVFLAAFHAIGEYSPTLKKWNNSVAPDESRNKSQVNWAKLGNIALAISLRKNPLWQGTMTLCCDQLGRIYFPFSDWSISLLSINTQDNQAITNQLVIVSASKQQFKWCLQGHEASPFLVMPRSDLLKLLVDNDGSLSIEHLEFPNLAIRPRLFYSSTISRSEIRYDPAGINDFSSHAGITGGIIQTLVDSLEKNSYSIYTELCSLIRVIRGFDAPAMKDGLVQSFSLPSEPRVIGFNIPYSKRQEPLLSPFCFTWLGHELGHTKNYLINDVAYLDGREFIANPSEMTSFIKRYRRKLSVRTLIQIPYVHLYEWILLMDFMESRFRGLPWQITENSLAFGEDLSEEIEESFQLIAENANLTILGERSVQHIRKLYHTASLRWKCIKTIRRRPISQLPGNLRVFRPATGRNVLFPLLRIKDAE